MKNFTVLFTRSFLAVLCWAASFYAANAQGEFVVSGIDPSGFPTIKAPFTATTATGIPNENMRNSDFIVKENGKQIPANLVSFSCGPLENNPEVSVLLVLDKSSSLDATQNNGVDVMEWVRFGAKTFVENLNFYKRTTVAVTTFHSYAELKHPFSNNKVTLQDSIDKIKAGGPTYYNNPFLAANVGAIDLMKTRPADVRKIVIFMTDGDPTDEPKTNEIIEALKADNIQVYSIALRLTPRTDFLQQVSKQTGGKMFTANTRDELVSIYKLLAIETQTSQPCVLTWQSPFSCTELDRIRNVEITFTPLAKTEKEQYIAPANSIASLKPTDNILYFGNPTLSGTPPVSVDIQQEAVLTAQKSDFYVGNITISPPGFFSIAANGITIGTDPTPKNPPFIVPAGQVLKVKVIFKQKDQRTFRQAELQINSTPCPQVISLVGGISQVQLISPNGTDPTPFKTCDTIDIKWSGVDKTQPVNLYYSTLNAAPWNWQPIASGATGWSFKWKAPQAATTYRIRVEVAQTKQMMWARQIGGTGEDISEAIDVTSNDLHAYIAGHYEGTTSSPLPMTSRGGKDIFIAKYDTDGSLLATITAGGSKNDRAYAVVSDPASNVYFTGHYEQQATFGAQTTTFTPGDGINLVVASYLPSFSEYPRWTVTAQGRSNTTPSTSFGEKIVYRIENGVPYIYVKGMYRGTLSIVGANLTPALPFRAALTPFYLRIRADGTPVAIQTGAFPGVTFPTDLKTDTDGNQNIYTTGSFTGTRTFPDGVTALVSKGRQDAFISKFGGIPGSSDSSDQIFEVVAPVIAFSITNENVGSIAVGQPIGKNLTALLTNTGTVDLVLDTALFIGSNASDFKIKSFPFKTVLKAGASTPIEIEFIPTGEGERITDLVVNGSCGAITLVALKGIGLPPCNTEAKNVSFGTVGLNTTRAKTATDYPCLLQYKGTGPVTFKPVIKGTDAASFTMPVAFISPAPDANGFVTLVPDQCFTATINFTPTTGKTYLAYIDYEGLENCGAPQTQLDGEGLRPKLVIDSYDWQKKRLETKHTVTISLRSEEDVIDAIINEIKLDDQVLTDFTYIITAPGSITFPYTLKPKEKIDFTVEFTPKATGARLNFINVIVESFNEPLQGKLSGFGVLPEIVARDTSFKPVMVGVPSQEIMNVYIHNRSGDTSLFVEKIETISNDGNDFTFNTAPTYLVVNQVIPANDSIPVKINFKPSQAGIRAVKLRIISDAKSGPEADPRVENIVTVTGEGIGLSRTQLVPFSNTLTCETPQQTIIFTNQSATTTAIITDFTPMSGDVNKFSFSPSTNITIAPGGTASVIVTFTPGTIGAYSADFKIENNIDNGSTIRVEGDVRTAPLTLTLDAAGEATPGEIISVPVRITTGNYGTIGVTSISFDVTTDQHLLILKNTADKMGWTFSESAPANGVITITGSGPALPSNVSLSELLALEFEVFLSTPNKTPITISNIVVGNDCIIPQSVNSEFALGGVCFLDARPVRLITQQYQLQEVTPNPASDQAKIIYGVALDAHTIIDLHNSNGVLVARIIDRDLKSGVYETIIPLNEVPAGVYFYTIQSGPYTATRKLVVTK